MPLDTHAEITKLALTNKSNEKKTFKLFSFMEWCLWNAATDMENFQRNFSTGEVEVEGSRSIIRLNTKSAATITPSSMSTLQSTVSTQTEKLLLAYITVSANRRQ